jgi:ribosome-associated protein
MDVPQLLKELEFSASGSSGPGGQHVNRTASRVSLRFDLENSQGLTAAEKELIRARLSHRLTQAGQLLLSCSQTRSQHKNKKLLIDRFVSTLQSALKKRSVRKKTTPGKGAIEKRLKSKKQQALKKAARKKPPIE